MEKIQMGKKDLILWLTNIGKRRMEGHMHSLCIFASRSCAPDLQLNTFHIPCESFEALS